MYSDIMIVFTMMMMMTYIQWECDEIYLQDTDGMYNEAL